MKRHPIFLVMCGLLLASGMALADNGFLYTHGSYFPFDFPGASSTYPNSFKYGQIVGQADGQAFLYSAGTFSYLDYPGTPLYSNAYDVNANGDIVGEVDFPAASFGFLYSGGVFHEILYPGAFATFAEGINNSGDIVGQWITPSLQTHGFLFSGGIFTSFDCPGATNSTAYGINNGGDIVGACDGHGFIYTGETFSFFMGASVSKINDNEDLVGYYSGGGGFLISDQGASFTSITYPGSEYTVPTGINEYGDIVGHYQYPVPSPDPPVLLLLGAGLPLTLTVLRRKASRIAGLEFQLGKMTKR